MTPNQMPTGGLVAVAVTPMTEKGDVDWQSLDRLMDFYISGGATGIALLGVMGEANRMTDSEAKGIVEASLDAIDGRVPTVVGVSDESLARVKDLAHHSASRGAAGILLQPFPDLAGDLAISRYFETAQEVLGDIPICVQDFPRASGVHLSVGAWEHIVSRCEGVVMLKAEDEPGLEKLSAIREAEARGLRRVTILTGNNGIHLVQELSRGSDGAMTGFAFPDVLAKVIALFRDGRVEEAEDLYDAYLPLNRHELRMGISVRKEVLRRRGIIRTAFARFPAPILSKTSMAELSSLIGRLEARMESSIIWLDADGS